MGTSCERRHRAASRYIINEPCLRGAGPESQHGVYARQRRAANDEPPNRSRQQSVQPRALSSQERATVIDTLHSETYCDQPPAEVYQSLLEEERYLCSVSTMHRLLKSVQETGDRRNQRPAQHHAIPRLLATAPNEVRSWDTAPSIFEADWGILCGQKVRHRPDQAIPFPHRHLP
jgi:hypothetical protein